ncbi:hypothetical protein ABIG06_006245 [Bradyrhizobium sp. USDA 326]|uniref:hypothetical protein n=1 Tax=unclassified Bradyrhizobium TaxID=2631580 RepID=UPI003515E42B
MPVGVQLSDLRRDLRAETGTSLNPAQGVQAQQSLDLVLDRQQRELWDAYNWPHLRFYVDVPLSQNQYIYAYPAAMPFDQILNIYVATNSSSKWQRLDYGIKADMIGPLGPNKGTPTRWANQVTVDTSGATPLTDPVGKLAITPTPSAAGMIMRIEGQAPLRPLTADTDKCVIDSKVIVLFAAAELLAAQKSEAAAMKLQKAQNHLRRLLQDQGADKRFNFNMGGSQRFGIDPDKSRRYVPYLDYIP